MRGCDQEASWARQETAARRREEEATQVPANEVGHGGTGCSTYNELRNTSDQEHISAATLTSLTLNVL